MILLEMIVNNLSWPVIDKLLKLPSLLVFFYTVTIFRRIFMIYDSSYKALFVFVVKIENGEN